MIKTSLPIFWVVGYSEEKFSQYEAADFNVCMWVSEHKKRIKNDSIVHNGCDFTKQMLSNEQPGSQPSSFYWCASDEY